MDLIQQLQSLLQPQQSNLRADGSQKDVGFLGKLSRPDGRISTELSIGVNMDGKDIEIPSLVPTLTEQEKQYLLNGGKPTQEIVNKAVKHARMRMDEGVSPFYKSGESKEVTIADYIKQNEGYNPKIYNDTKKIPTTGYGFNINAEHVRQHIPKDVLNKKRALTKEESDDIFMKVFNQAEKDARQYIGSEKFDSLSVPQKTAILDMSYNMGLTSLKKFKKMKEAILKNDFDSAAKELLDSDYARIDVPSRALKNSKMIRMHNKEKK